MRFGDDLPLAAVRLRASRNPAEGNTSALAAANLRVTLIGMNDSGYSFVSIAVLSSKLRQVGTDNARLRAALQELINEYGEESGVALIATGALHPHDDHV